jgi:hypothetical protein
MFVRTKNKLSKTQTLSCGQITLPVTELSRNWQPTKVKQDGELVLND